MNFELFDRFSPTIRALTDAELTGNDHFLNKKMRLAIEGDIEVCYVPFEYVNPKARVVVRGRIPNRCRPVVNSPEVMAAPLSL